MKQRNIELSQQKPKKKSDRIFNKVDSTSQLIHGRGGLPFIMNYTQELGIFDYLADKFNYLRQSNKGISIKSVFQQLFAVMLDGSKLDLVVFDELKKDPAYAELLEMDMDELASSHQIKRIFAKFENTLSERNKFRDLLGDVFMSHLKTDQPSVVVLGIDTMVLDNRHAVKREGCKYTYKKTNGFQPFHVYWKDKIIDLIFRPGNHHSNHGDDVKSSLKRIVDNIRKHYSPDVPIIVKMDSGFLADENFTYFEEELNIYYICGGKKYSYMKDFFSSLNEKCYGVHIKEEQEWRYLDFVSRLKQWDNLRRTIYIQRRTEQQGQLVFDFATTDRIIYTNLGFSQELDPVLEAVGEENYFSSDWIINAFHKRACDELVNRSIKDFIGRENLPFKHFSSNQVFYYLLVIAHQIMKSYQQDVCLDPTSYATTFRRKYIDFAVKIVRHAGKKILKVHENIFKKLRLKTLWELCRNPARQICYCWI